MAVHAQRLSFLRQIKRRRHTFSHYLTSHSSRYSIWIIVLLCLISLLTLGQTGMVATKGYAVAELQSQRTELLRDMTHLEVQLASSRSLDRVRSRAEHMGMRPATRNQIRYVTIVEPQQQPTPAIEDQKAHTDTDTHDRSDTHDKSDTNKQQQLSDTRMLNTRN